MNWDTFVCIDCPHVYYTETNPLRHAEILKPNLPLNWTITWYIFCLNNRIYLTWSFRDHRKNRRKIVHIFLFDNFDLKSKPKSRTMIISSPIMHELSMSNCPMYWHIARVPICCLCIGYLCHMIVHPKLLTFSLPCQFRRFLWFNDPSLNRYCSVSIMQNQTLGHIFEFI